MDIFEEVKKLNFPIGEYVVVGSGIMQALKIRDSHDIDIVVSENIFKTCKNQGWEVLPWTYEKPDQIYLKKGNIELYRDVNCREFNPTLEELIAKQEVINEIAFASLQDTINFKTEYAKNGKEKHLKDIRLIEEYLRNIKNKN